MKNKLLLDHLQTRLNQLAEQLKSTADTPCAKARFDERLFHSHNTCLLNYFQETLSNFEQLRQAVGINHCDQVSWIAKKLINQISALQRELPTKHLRKKGHQSPRSQPNLYEKFAEHQEYQRRLKVMITDRQALISEKSESAPRLRKEIFALQGRLERCQDALKRIEQAIEPYQR